MRIPRVESCCCGCNLRQGSAIIAGLFAVLELAKMIFLSVEASNELNVIEGEYRSSYRAILICGATLSAVLFVTNLILLLGVHKQRLNLVVLWLVVYAVMAVLSIVGMWISSYTYFSSTSFLEGVIFLGVSFAQLALSLYCLLVVYSYYYSQVEKAYLLSAL